MAIKIKGQVVIDDNQNIISSGEATATNFKTGTTNVHDSGIEVSGINVLGGDTPIGSEATIYDNGNASFTGNVLTGDTSSTYVNLENSGFVSIKGVAGSTGPAFGITRVNDADYTAEIKADGSATFNGQVTTELAFVSRGNDSVNYLFQGQNGSGSEVCNIKNDGSATFTGQVYGLGFTAPLTLSGQYAFRGDLNGSVTSQINADGTATFDGEVVAGVRDSQGVFMTPGGALEGFNGGSRKYSLGSDGSATFNSFVDVGSNELAGNFNTYINAPIGDDYFIASKAPGDLSTSPILFGVKTDGSAEFSGSINATVGPLAVPSGYKFYSGNFNGSETFRVNADGSAKFGTTTDYVKIDPVTNGLFIVENGASTINLDKNGSAKFGPLNISSSTGYGAQVDMAANAATVNAQCQQTASQYTLLFAGYMGTNRNFHVTADGSASFAGTIDAAGFTVNGAALSAGSSDASTLSGMAPSTGSTGDTIAQRHENGSLSMVYAYTSWVQARTDINSGFDPAAFVVMSDGWYYHFDKAAMKSALDVGFIPQNYVDSAYTLTADDKGKHIKSNGHNVTVPSGVFSTGDVITIYNFSYGGITLSQGSGVTMYQAGTGSTGNRSLANFALATILCTNTNEFVVSGTGVS